MAQRTDRDWILKERNTARFFVENPQIAWVVLAATLAWGVYGYVNMPKQKDPAIGIGVSAAVCAWPGMSAEQIEWLVTEKIERKLAENPHIKHIETTVRTNVSVTTVILRAGTDVDRDLEDLRGKLDSIHDLPENAGPIVFLKDFKDTATLMLTVASPKASDVEIGLRAQSVRRAIEETRAKTVAGKPRASLVISFPTAARTEALTDTVSELARWLEASNAASDVRIITRPTFVALDAQWNLDDGAAAAAFQQFTRDHIHASDLSLDGWAPVLIHDPAETSTRLSGVAGPKYSYRALDDFTDTIRRVLLSSPKVSRVSRGGVLGEVVNLTYSQEKMAEYGVPPLAIRDALRARNIALPGGLFEAGGRSIPLEPTGAFSREKDLGNVIIDGSNRGSPVYLRDLVEVSRDYESPPRYLNALTVAGPDGKLQRSKAITLSVMMPAGDQIFEFGTEVNRLLETARATLPPDLIIERTSDQPLQVQETVDLFMRSLLEAVILVILTALIGFWEWRSAMLIAISIPLTLAMTFGMMHALHVDIQQVSIASLIIALGLLVDDPVVANDAIKRELERGQPGIIAAWLGPSKLANAIVFATITNIAAYLPFLTVRDHVGEFIYSLPVVLTCSLVASRIVSMTFVPLIGRYFLRAPATAHRTTRFELGYRRLSAWLLDHRKRLLVAVALLLVAVSVPLAKSLRTSFFPKDLSYFFYVDVWTPEDSTFANTERAAIEVERLTRKVAEEFGREHPGPKKEPREVLTSITTAVGGGVPRFWFSVNPSQAQLSYAQLLVRVQDKYDTAELVRRLQAEFDRSLIGAHADAQQLETGEPVGIPVSIRFIGDDGPELRRIAERAKRVLRAAPTATKVRDDWGGDTMVLPVMVDADRANLSGVTNADVALSTVAATNGLQVTTLRQKDREIPVIIRLRATERQRFEDLKNLYVFSAHDLKDSGKVPLQQVASLHFDMQPEKIVRRDHFRTVTVSAFPADGTLASETLASVLPQLRDMERRLPPGYRMEIGGEQEAQQRGFKQVAIALLLSVVLIYLVLVVEFRSAVKPAIVFAAIPFGAVGALAALALAGVPFGFMGFLGIASLVGVIVSHVVVLFDFIEEAHERGMPLREALIEAGIVRLRPVMITVAATVFGLIPLALHGGPLWEPLCYAQIGGLSIAAFITLLLVPVMYSVFVLDLRILSWGSPPNEHSTTVEPAEPAEPKTVEG